MSKPDGPYAFVLDAGALIALEKAAPAMTGLLLRVRSGQARLIVPDAALAQVWRGGAGRQARIAALLGLEPEHCTKVPLDTEAAKRIGVMIGACGHSDVIDVHVVLAAQDHRAAVITSDRNDLMAIDPTLEGKIVEI